MVMTVIAMCGFASLATPAKAAASAGDLIKMEGNSSVYYFDGEKRFVFPNETTYMSWYSDFSGVVTIESSELYSYKIGGNVTMRPGTKLVKITTDPSVYAVEQNGLLRKIQNEAQATALYGTDWAKRVTDVSDELFVNYTMGEELSNGEVPAGSLVKTNDSASVYYFDGSEYREIGSEDAMNANRLWFSNVITIEAVGTEGDPITGMEEALVNTSEGSTSETGPVVTGSGLMVSLNSATPAAMSVPASSSVEFLKVNLTAANDGPVNVNSMTLTAFGLSNSSVVDDVTIYSNGVKVGSSKDINSDRNATFNFSNPIYVAAGSTKTITVKATVSETYGSYGLGIASASAIISTGATVSGSFPIKGNLMSPVESTVGSVTVSAIDSGTGYNASFGEDDVLLSDFDLEVAEEDALFQSLRLYNYGDRNDSIISNPVLYIDGEMVAEGTYADRYVSFDFNYQVEKSDSILVEVRADVNISDADDTVELDFKANSDIVAVGMTHGFTLTVDAVNSLTTVVTLTTGEFSMDMDKSVTPAKEVKPGTDNVVLGTFSLKSNGEDATVLLIDGSDDNFEITQSTATTSILENIKLVDKSNGSTYDLTASTTAPDDISVYELSLDEEIYLTKGVTKTFELRADVLETANENTDLKVVLNKSALSIEGEASGAEITDITPAEVTSAVTTVKSASLSLNEVVLTDLSVVAGANDQLIYQANVKAGSADDVRLQTIKVATTSAAFIDDNITELSIYLDGELMTSVSNRIVESTPNTVTFSSLSNNIVEAGETSVITIEANFSSNPIIDTDSDFDLTSTAVTARSVEGNDSIDVVFSETATASRLVTIADQGKLTVSMLTSDSSANSNSFVLAGLESDSEYYLGEIKFTTENEAIMVEDLTLTSGGDATSQDISSVKLYDEEGNLIAEETVDSDANAVFEDVNLTFDADESTSLFIAVVAKGINNGNATATARVKKTISYSVAADTDVTAKGVSSSEDITSTDLTVNTDSSNTATIVGSKLNSVSNALSDGKLTSGLSRTIAKYTLVFDNGSNRDTSNDAIKAYLDTFDLTVATGTATATTFQLYIEGDTSNKATSTDGTTWDGLSNLEGMDGEVTLVVTANITGVSDNSWLQTQLNVDGSDLVYYDLDSGKTYDAAGRVSATIVDGALLEN